MPQAEGGVRPRAGAPPASGKPRTARIFSPPPGRDAAGRGGLVCPHAPQNLALAALTSLLTLAVFTLAPHPAAAQTDNLLIEARIIAERQEDNRVKVALQLPRARQLDSPRYGPDRFATSSIDLVDHGPQRCPLGLILAPGDYCRFPDSPSWFRVFANGLAAYDHVADRNRIHVEDVWKHFSGGVIASYDFTAQRQDDGGFRIVHMNERLIQPETQPEP